MGIIKNLWRILSVCPKYTADRASFSVLTAAIGYCFTWSQLMWLLKGTWKVLFETTDLFILFIKCIVKYQVNIPPLRLTFFSSRGVPYWAKLGMHAVCFSWAFFFFFKFLIPSKSQCQVILGSILYDFLPSDFYYILHPHSSKWVTQGLQFLLKCLNWQIMREKASLPWGS